MPLPISTERSPLIHKTRKLSGSAREPGLRCGKRPWQRSTTTRSLSSTQPAFKGRALLKRGANEFKDPNSAVDDSFTTDSLQPAPGSSFPRPQPTTTSVTKDAAAAVDLVSAAMNQRIEPVVELNNPNAASQQKPEVLTAIQEANAESPTTTMETRGANGRLIPSVLLDGLFSGTGAAMKKNFDAADAQGASAGTSDSQNTYAYLNLARAWLAAGEYAKAVADLTRITQLDRTHVIAQDLTARIWATCPDPKIRDGKKAVQSATTACA